MMIILFFFFKKKTAYEMSASLVGSEMCIRDRTTRVSVLVNMTADVKVYSLRGDTVV